MPKNTELIKKKIVDTYRRGVCDHNGNTIPKHKRGMSGKGCHFIHINTKQYRDGYDKIDWSK